jgi:hypothetical protein
MAAIKKARIPRQWLLIARHNAGKSTFAAAMNPEYLTLDMDGRWAEQDLTEQSHLVTDTDPLKIIDRMEVLRGKLMGKVGTVVIDSGTGVLDYIQSKGRLMEAAAKESQQKFNKDNVNRMKADTMRVLRLAALRWKCDVLWIFHIEDGKHEGKDKERTTISATEMERMKQNLNAILTIVQDGKGKRGIRIEWCRYNNNVAAGQIIWDELGHWRGVPDKVADFCENFRGTEGYNGKQYSSPWLMDFLKVKGVEYPNVDEMKKALSLDSEPAWFDRNAWGVYIEKALPKK